ncbi:amidohydrolase family protein [Cellulomonas marina]|uniref:Cytosine deaminase n=1 Tax=Cellulomonas marina TaxID=988821 RepID=A0A1I0V893_9CELL|nr:amidohydrolase family protein [Cellulomonas marina]GIG29224.1 cytosine deaminase [Cellulomonas marina]SFA72555.1 cytosine deaminase [Cellulomonas marina]
MTSVLPQPLRLIRNATLADGRLVDVALDGATVAAVTPAAGPAGDSGDHSAGDSAAGDDVLDLTGFVLLPAPAEPHAHLDKALSWDRIRPPMGDLRRAIESWQAYAATMDVDEIADRARTQLLDMLAQGTTAVRSHVDVLLGPEPLRGAQALVRVREELAGLVDLELVALASHLSDDASVEAVLDLGVELVGGAPHLAPDPQHEVARLLALARRRGRGVDLHADEGLGGADTLTTYARTVRDWPAGTSLSAGHCVRLGTLAGDELAAAVAEVRASDIGVISLPITNLYLQGWEHPVSTPRGLTALRALLDAGVRVAAGADNVRDPFNPVGRGDALETASLLVTAGHLTLDEAYAAVSTGARSVLHLPVAGVVPGAAAELLAVRGADLAEVVATASPDRYVVHAGRLVARTRVERTVAAPATALPTGPLDAAGPAAAPAPRPDALLTGTR